MAYKKNSASSPSIKSDIAKNQICPLYIFHGKESYLKEYYLKLLKEKIIAPGTEGFNYHLIEGKSLTADELIDAVESLPVMSERKLIVIRDFDLYKSDEAMRPVLTELIADLPDYICLVFFYDVLEYKTDARQTLYKLIQKNGRVCEFSLQKDHDLIPWIKRRFASLDRKIDNSEAEYLLFLCGQHMTNLAGEIAKIASFSAGPAITKADIDAIALPVTDAVVFDLTDALAEHRFDKANEIADRLLSMRLESYMIVASIGRQMRQLYSARLCIESAKSSRYLMDLWGFRSDYPANKLLKSAARLTLSWCRSAVRICTEIDRMMKTSLVDKDRALQLLLSKLSMETV